MARYYETDYGQGSRRGPDETERGPSRRADDEARTWFGDEETARQHSRFTDVMRAGDLMTPNPLTVHPRDLVDYAARLMRDCDCGVAPVVDQGGRLIGMVSDRDIVVRLIAERVDARNAVVADCMTNGAFACHFYDPIRECIRLMARHQVRRLPVVDDDGHVVGIISQGDLARHAGDYPGYGERRALADVLCAISEPAHSTRR